jgi:hypothetical protein
MSPSFGSSDPELPEIVELELSGTAPKSAELLRQAPRVRFLLDPNNDAPGDADPPGDADAPPPDTGEYRVGRLALLAYTLGPFTPLLLRQGRHNATWTFVAMLSPVSWVALFWRWSEIRGLLEQGIVPLLPGLLTMCCFTLAGIAAWCRAIFLAGSDSRFVPERLPPWLRRPLVMTSFSLLAPGLGHLAAGHPRRAACAFWIAATTRLSILTLVWAGWLWRCNQSAVAGGLPGLALETGFLTSAVLAAAGVLLWIGSALDGLRLRLVRAHGRSELRGDWLAATLLLTILLLLFAVQPVKVGRQLDQFSGAMRYAGFRMIPLCFEATASQLDPAEPKYRMQMAELLESLGKKKTAKDIRERLRRRWDAYAEGLLREELHEGEELLPAPIDIVTDEADSTATPGRARPSSP